MILPLLQVVLMAALVLYAGKWGLRARRRRDQKWEDILARLRANDWGADRISEQYLWKSGIVATPEDIWQLIQGPKGLWAMYVNAPVFVELADYATAHGDNVDKALMDNLRSDAFHIRMCVLMALAQYAMTQAGMGAKMNAHHAATLYTSMVAKTTSLLQEHAAMMLPRFVDAV